MRIIAGKAKGRLLVAPDTRATRPVTDRVREAVFSILGRWVEGASVLDLYAGSGSFGLEALSRGASRAVLVEMGRKALEALRANVEGLRLGGEVVEKDVAHYLAGSSDRFDLVFIDPPWQMPATDLARDLAVLDRILAPSGEVVLSRRSGDDAPPIPSTWRVATDRRYGDTRILRYVKEETPR